MNRERGAPQPARPAPAETLSPLLGEVEPHWDDEEVSEAVWSDLVARDEQLRQRVWRDREEDRRRHAALSTQRLLGLLAWLPDAAAAREAAPPLIVAER